MRIRPATPLDIPGLGEVDPLVRGLDLARATLVEDAVHGRRDSLCLLAATETGSRLAGYIVLRRGHLFGHDCVERLVVAPAARRRGVGSELLAAAVAAASGPRVLAAATVANVPMRALLAGCGWRLAGRLRGLVPGDDPAGGGDVLVAWVDGPDAGGSAGPGPRRLFHLALREDWERARRAGEYRISTLGARLEEVGFVHAAFGQQVAGVADRQYARVEAPLVLLVLDRARIRVPVRVEPAPGTDEVYPHVYGPVPADAVLDAVALHRDAAGRLLLPPLWASLR
jgi:glutathione S-transferase